MTNSVEDEFAVNNELESNLKIKLLSNEKNKLKKLSYISREQA